MLASRHHNRCRKFGQSSRATSALNDSSNQKGLQARHTKRITALPAMSNRSVNPRTQPLESRRSDELFAPSFAAASRGRMLSVHVQSLSSRQFPDDTMLGKNGVYAYFRNWFISVLGRARLRAVPLENGKNAALAAGGQGSFHYRR